MVPESALAVLFVGFVGTGLLAFFVLRMAEALKLLAEPNARSSHQQPTPSVGGLALLVPVVVLFSASTVAYPEVGWVLAAVLLLGAVSLLDDLLSLPALPRLAAQVLAFGLALAPFQAELAVWWLPLLYLAGVWHINLFNFMDGIDGIAGLQTVTVAMALLTLAPTMAPWLGYLCCVLVGGALGFLVYNWAPARLFMGDVGSTVLGLLLVLTATLLGLAGQVSVTALLIVLAGFWVDATYTLAVRVVTGQRFLAAHRSHAYQRLAQRYGHAPVSLGLGAVNLGWLLPLALLTERWGGLGAVWLLIAVAPLAWLCKTLQAGQRQGEP